MNRYKFQSDSLLELEARAVSIIHDESITESERKRLLNRLRMECMRDHSFYSRETKALDGFIRKELGSRQSEPKRAAAS